MSKVWGEFKGLAKHSDFSKAKEGSLDPLVQSRLGALGNHQRYGSIEEGSCNSTDDFDVPCNTNLVS